MPARQVYGWRFPAEFRTRPVGWTERKQKAAPVQPQESSVGGEAVRDPVLDRGPESLAGAGAFVREPDASNAPAGAQPAALAFAALPQAGATTSLTEASVPSLLASGPAVSVPAVQAAHECQSNAGPTLLLRELGMAVVAPRLEAEPAMDFLAIGEASAWPSCAGNAAARLDEASYAMA